MPHEIAHLGLNDYALDGAVDTVLMDDTSAIKVQGGQLETEDGRLLLKIGHELQIVGRARGSALYVDHETVSLVHAELQATSKGVRLKDRNSRNGTFIVRPGGDETQLGEAYLVRPCHLRFGATRFRFRPEWGSHVVHPGVDRFGDLNGTTPEMRALFAMLDQHSRGRRSFLIGGETGTGKERVARAIHQASPRRDKPFSAINCAAVSPNCVESELFGHVRGAFTGAERNHPGVFVDADGGTLLFDEVGEMSLDMQAKLLRVLQEGEVRPVGGKPRRVDVRTIFATHVDLEAAINRGAFRQDLFFRLAQVRVFVPPLRERLDDLPLLLEDILRELDRPDVTFDDHAMTVLRGRDWPGNVRELATLVACVVEGFAGSRITPAELRAAMPMPRPIRFAEGNE
jgi:Sigma-54 interaction domain/FHA domain